MKANNRNVDADECCSSTNNVSTDGTFSSTNDPTTTSTLPQHRIGGQQQEQQQQRNNDVEHPRNNNTAASTLAAIDPCSSETDPCHDDDGGVSSCNTKQPLHLLQQQLEAFTATLSLEKEKSNSERRPESSVRNSAHSVDSTAAAAAIPVRPANIRFVRFAPVGPPRR